MKTLMIRYKTSEARAADNEALVHRVYDELRAKAPAGLRYATYRLADGVTFLHVATLDSVEPTAITGLPSFRAFQRDLEERCVELPVVTEWFAVDSYPLAGPRDEP